MPVKESPAASSDVLAAVTVVIIWVVIGCAAVIGLMGIIVFVLTALAP